MRHGARIWARDGLNAYLARAGVASRRGADELIKAGRVRVNGPRRAEHVRLRGRPGRPTGARLARQPLAYGVLLHKPADVVTTARDPHGAAPSSTSSATRRGSSRSGASTRTRPERCCSRTTATSRTGSPTRATRSTRSTSPRSRGDPAARRAEAASPTGFTRRTNLTAPARVRRLGASTLELTIHEGRKHQVKRMLAAVGHPVTALHRSRYAGPTLDGLQPGSRGRSRPRRSRS